MDKRIKIAIQAALAAGKEILKFDPATASTEVKSTAGDLVTAADLASEKVIVGHLQAHFPGEVIISEETTTGHELLQAERLPELTGWVIDPLDGTNNFKRGMAYSGISIAYVENGQAVIGVVYDPYRQELYRAVKGQGAKRNDQLVHVSDKTAFDAGTRVCTSNSYESGTLANLQRFDKLGHVWVDVLGSAVLIMTDVASGRIDLYHHNGLKPWDNAAAFLIAEEAGAKITDLQGNSTAWLTSEAVIGNSDLVDTFIKLATA